MSEKSGFDGPSHHETSEKRHLQQKALALHTPKKL
jgi:hypothetical protein